MNNCVCLFKQEVHTDVKLGVLGSDARLQKFVLFVLVVGELGRFEKSFPSAWIECLRKSGLESQSQLLFDVTLSSKSE